MYCDMGHPKQDCNCTLGVLLAIFYRGISFTWFVVELARIGRIKVQIRELSSVGIKRIIMIAKNHGSSPTGVHIVSAVIYTTKRAKSSLTVPHTFLNFCVEAVNRL